MHQFKWTEVPIHYKNPSKSVGKASLSEAFRNLWALTRRDSLHRRGRNRAARAGAHGLVAAPPVAPPTGLVGVLTTIQSPTACVAKLGVSLAAAGAGLIVVGDKKGPAKFDLPGAEFVPLARQKELPFRIAGLLPVGHYARKNLGYLLAVRRGAACIYETDDDNAPNAHWQPRGVVARAQAAAPRVWMNVYRAFTNENIWPRGLPLDKVNDPAAAAHDSSTPLADYHCPIQQGLADNAPDVDAVWRLILGPAVPLPPRCERVAAAGDVVPVQQSVNVVVAGSVPATVPTKLLLVPHDRHLASFVAQRCLWELGHGMVFHAAEVDQDRNPHNLMRDFRTRFPVTRRTTQSSRGCRTYHSPPAAARSPTI